MVEEGMTVPLLHIIFSKTIFLKVLRLQILQLATIYWKNNEYRMADGSWWRFKCCKAIINPRINLFNPLVAGRRNWWQTWCVFCRTARQRKLFQFAQRTNPENPTAQPSNHTRNTLCDSSRQSINQAIIHANINLFILAEIAKRFCQQASQPACLRRGGIYQKREIYFCPFNCSLSKRF